MQAEDDIIAENIHFLQTHLEDDNENSEHIETVQEHPPLPVPDDTRVPGLPRLEELQRQLRVLEDRHVRWQRARQEAATLSEQVRTRAHPYGSRVPNQQSLYDWAPAETGEDQELNNLLVELRAQLDVQRNHGRTLHGVRTRVQGDSETLTREHTTRQPPNGSVSTTYEPSLRSAAILQSVRRNHRFSARSRDLMQRYVLDRDRAVQEADGRSSGEPQRFAVIIGTPANETSPDDITPFMRPTGYSAEERATLETLRRNYLEDPSSKPTEFEKIITLLHSQRSDIGEVDQSDYAHASDSRDGHLWLDRRITCKSFRFSPQPTSWLARGTVLSGFQQTATIGPNGNIVHNLSNGGESSNIAPPPFHHARPWLSHQRMLASPSSSQQARHPDHWAVKVTIHDVDWTAMTLQGTMEAFNVPSEPLPGSGLVPNSEPVPKSTFCTYLEGELLDFSRNTLFTESYTATPDVDAHHWRKLEPFRSMTDESIARALLDPLWVEEQLMEKYQLMRWKETCFVKPLGHSSAAGDSASPSSSSNINGPDGSGYGLSISGFYYVSLRRSDGYCEGLYYDPQSRPYQHLELRSEAKRWSMGSWEFR